MDIKEFMEREHLINLCKKSYKNISLNNVISYIKLINKLDHPTYIIKTNFIDDSSLIYKSILTTICDNFPQLNYQISDNLPSSLKQLIKINLYAIKINDDISLILDNSYVYISNFNFTLGFYENRRYLGVDITNEYYQLRFNNLNQLSIEYNKDQSNANKFVIDASTIKPFEPLMLINRFNIDKPLLLDNKELFIRNSYSERW